MLGPSVLATLREVDRVFSTYRADSFVSRLGRGEIDVADCPPEVAEVLALGERARLESGGAFDVAGAAPRAARSSTPAAWSRAGPSTGRPRRCAR